VVTNALDTPPVSSFGGNWQPAISIPVSAKMKCTIFISFSLFVDGTTLF